MTRGPLGNARPLSLAALDAAISETIGRPVRADRLARDDRVYRWVVRRAIAEGSLRFNCTYAEAAAGAGYPVPRLNCRANRREARHMRVSTVYRALSSLKAAGLVRFHGVKREDGRWRCLSVGLTPAAFGPLAPFGRSRRGPHRRPHGRISFVRRNGTSPPVVTTKNRSEERGRTRARAREPDEGAGGGESAFARALLAASQASVQPEDPPDAPRPWPNERFDLVDAELVEAAELFEELFHVKARFSFTRRADHGPRLRRILDRFDRFAGWRPEVVALGIGGGDQRGRREGMRRLRALLERQARYRRLGNPRARAPQSLAYFLPRLDQESKAARAAWRKANGHPTWR